MKSVLADVVSRYYSQSENLCSESLALIINHSEILQNTFAKFVNQRLQLDLPLQTPIHLENQIHSVQDSAIPDVQIRDDSGRTYLLEAKFWSGLTENQPNKYLERIRRNNGGALIFLVPDRRLTHIQSEVKKRMDHVHECHQEGTNLQIEDWATVGFIGWSELLAALWAAAEKGNDPNILHNLYQIRSVVDKMDRSGFVPFDPLLFSPVTGKFRDQLMDLVDELVENNPRFNTDNLKTGGNKYSYARFFKLDGLGCFLYHSSELWMLHQETPLYFCISSKDWKTGERISIMEHLVFAFKRANLRHYPDTDTGGSNPALALPLTILLGPDKDAVYEDLNRQILDILTAFDTCKSIGSH
jgi:hypothetical protein